MLRITMQSDANSVSHYFEDGHDYLAEGLEHVGGWGGKGAELLGLRGEVDQRDFAALAHNVNPATGRKLTIGNRPSQRVGYDMTFSAPKSVTLALEITQDTRILDAFSRAVRDTLNDIEADAFTRDQRGGEQRFVPADLVHATFVHRSARPVGGLPDPQLHAHAFVFNVSHADGRWTTPELGNIKTQAWYYEAVFQARLAKSLVDIGYGVRRKGKFFELESVSDELVEKFSRRTQLIEAEAERRGVTNPDFKAELGGKTREHKGSMAYQALREYWLARLSPEEVSDLTHLPGQTAPLPTHAQSAAYALSHAFEREAVVATRKALEHGLRHGVGSATVEGLRAEMGRQGMLTKGDRCTTRAVLAREAEVIRFARDGQGACRPARAAGINGVRPDLVTPSAGRSTEMSRSGKSGPPMPASGGKLPARESLNPGQRAAVSHVLASRDRVTLVRGAAGTGKTFALKVAADALREAGLAVQAIAISSGAAQELEPVDAGAATVARFLVDTRMQDRVRGGVVILDEASLLGTTQAADLVGVLERIDARLVAVGDIKQHNAVAAGSPFKAWQDYAALPVAEMTEVMRQRGSYKALSEELSEHKVGKALDRLDAMGWVREMGEAERLDAIAADYLDALHRRQSVLIVAPTHAEADAVTARVRQALKQDGRIEDGERDVLRLVPLHLTQAELAAPAPGGGAVAQFFRASGKHKPGDRVALGDAGALAGARGGYAAYRPERLALAAGDVVRVTANGKTKDGKHKLLNGSTYAVKGFTKAGDITLANGWTVAADFGHLAHGYVTTSHASQGKTVDTVLVSESSVSFPAAGREQLYVSLSRGKRQAVLYTDDFPALRLAVDRSQAKENAHDTFAEKPTVPVAAVRHSERMGKLKRLAAKAIEQVRQLTHRKDKAYEREMGR